MTICAPNVSLREITPATAKSATCTSSGGQMAHPASKRITLTRPFGDDSKPLVTVGMNSGDGPSFSASRT
jgi:hypothetical protein